MNEMIRLLPLIKTNCKLIKDLHIRPETMELQEETIEDTGINKDFLDMTHKCMGEK
jgi:hypothetical protein